MTSIKTWNKAALLASLVLAQTAAIAQTVTVSYSPVSSVPTLSEWALATMAVVLAAVALYAMRKGAHSKVIVSLALGAFGFWGAGAGRPVVQSAWALSFPVMDNPAGGVTTPLPLFSGIVPINNTTNVPLRIISVSDTSVQNATGTTCQPGSVVPVGASCNLDTGDT
ncbi:midcut-by-XrtH protein [Acidovorax sp.]|uniref:midcut-by-XrtH protein n=1 Tax=Acidovorax sp. TaxID=1872122 RepID=UPI0031DD619D